MNIINKKRNQKRIEETALVWFEAQVMDYTLYSCIEQELKTKMWVLELSLLKTVCFPLEIFLYPLLFVVSPVLLHAKCSLYFRAFKY